MSIEERIAKLEARVAALEEAAKPADIDGKYGDPVIRKDPPPKYWSGESFVGSPMSECSPAYLDALAKYKDACAIMNERSGDPAKAKYIGYDRTDAKRARAWAERLRASGATTAKAKPKSAPSATADDTDEIPF